jgi:hypothetical protein
MNRLKKVGCAMASIEIEEHELKVKMRMLDVVLALHPNVSVPLSHLRGVRVRPPEADYDSSVKDRSAGNGLFLAGKMAIGSVVLEDGLSFFDVRDPSRTIALDLDESQLYRHVVIELDDETPENACARIESVLVKYREHGAWKEIPTATLERSRVEAGNSIRKDGP